MHNVNMRSRVRSAWAALFCYAAGGVAVLFISPGVSAWYAALAKPLFAPSITVFVPLLVILYGLMAVAVVDIWDRDKYSRENRGWVQLFFAHLFGNAAWIIFFFGFHAILIALLDSIVLSIAVVLLVCAAWEIHRRAAYFLLPYLAFTLAATAFTWSVWLLN